MSRVYSRTDLRWDDLKLYCGNMLLAQLIPADTMWRILIDGALTDMVNLPRAKDAALSLALAKLNQHVT